MRIMVTDSPAVSWCEKWN